MIELFEVCENSWISDEIGGLTRECEVIGKIWADIVSETVVKSDLDQGGDNDHRIQILIKNPNTISLGIGKILVRRGIHYEISAMKKLTNSQTLIQLEGRKDIAI